MSCIFKTFVVFILLPAALLCLQVPSLSAGSAPAAAPGAVSPAKTPDPAKLAKEKKELISELYEILSEDEDGTFASKHGIVKKQVDGKTRYFLNDKPIEEADEDTLSDLTTGTYEYHAIANNEAEKQRREMENMLNVVKTARRRAEQLQHS